MKNTGYLKCRLLARWGACIAGYILTCIFLLMAVWSRGQPASTTFRQVAISYDTGWIQIDTLTLIPGSVRIENRRTGDTLAPSLFQINNYGILLDTSLNSDTVIFEVEYRVFPYNFSAPVARLDTGQIRRAYEGIEFSYNPFAEQEDGLPDFGRVNYTGSFSRGISYGNSQNLVLNSDLNLQMSGQLTEDIELLAAITDNSIPVQPEGNTARLREFDKVFVQLNRKRSSLIAGDYELRNPDRYFMKYFRKLQGATIANTSSIAEDNTLRSRASVAIARGQFTRNIITPLEGNQGPYRLRGEEGESFIIVLAGTERVYLNGRLLQRGVEADYIIDYNAAGLTFTPKHLINKDSRIVAEFEYADQSYLRSMYAADVDYTTERARTYFSFYSDQDSKNSFAQGTLSEMEKAALRRAGDSESGALVSGIEPIEAYNPLRVTYALRDTVICGRTDTILSYSTNQRTALYTVRFTNVGQGNGNYILDNDQPANGRVFKWIPPLNCMPQGSFAPLIQLVAPKRKQLMTAGTAVRLSANAQLKAEIGLSNFDKNRFSDIGDANDVGLAGFTEYRQAFRLGETNSGWGLETSLSYEFVQKNFNFLYPYRPQEFTRDWNLSSVTNGQLGNNDLAKANEHLSFGSVALKKAGLGSVAYRFGGFWRADTYTGNKHFVKLAMQQKWIDTWAEVSLLTAETQREQSRFFRPKFSIEIPFIKKENSYGWAAGIYGEREYNHRTLSGSDTLSATSFYYDFLKGYLKKTPTENFETTLGFSRRWDHAPDAELFRASTTADDLEWSGIWHQNKNARLEWSLNYRRLTIENKTLTSQKSGETYLGRINYDHAAWKGAIRSNTSYEISSGQEPKIQFNYLRVNDGEGVYQWNDYNKDEVAQPAEFEIAAFQDSANFVRVTLVTDEFIRSNNVQFNQSLRIEPRAVWFSRKGLKKFMSRFSTLSTWQITRRVRDVAGISPWNPFELDIIHTALVTLNSNIRNTLFFNRAHPKYDLQFGMASNQNQLVVTTGFERRQLEEQFLQSRWNLTPQWSLRLGGKHNTRSNAAENFSNRNFRVENWFITPEITWLPSTSFRLTTGYAWQQGDNLAAEEAATTKRLRLESTWNPGIAARTATSLRLQLTYAEVQFRGNPNSPVGFAMLAGLRTGQNYLWKLTLDRQLVRYIRLSLNYEGRKTGDARIVHLGSVQVTAVF